MDGASGAIQIVVYAAVERRLELFDDSYEQ